MAAATSLGLPWPAAAQLGEDRDDDVGRVDLEVPAQSGACVGTAEAVGPERREGCRGRSGRSDPGTAFKKSVTATIGPAASASARVT